MICDFDKLKRADFIVLSTLVSYYKKKGYKSVYQKYIYHHIIQKYGWHKTTFYNRINFLTSHNFIKVVKKQKQSNLIKPTFDVSEFEAYYCEKVYDVLLKDEPLIIMDYLLDNKLLNKQDMNYIIRKFKKVYNIKDKPKSS